MEIKLNEVEVIKLKMQVGETLVIIMKSDHLESELLQHFKQGFKELFPDNKVVVIAMYPEDNIQFQTIAAAPVSDMSCASSPVGYCGDCNCGKREQIEGNKS